jgi:hypothetical protein
MGLSVGTFFQMILLYCLIFCREKYVYNSIVKVDEGIIENDTDNDIENDSNVFMNGSDDNDKNSVRAVKDSIAARRKKQRNFDKLNAHKYSIEGNDDDIDIDNNQNFGNDRHNINSKNNKNNKHRNSKRSDNNKVNINGTSSNSIFNDNNTIDKRLLRRVAFPVKRVMEMISQQIQPQSDYSMVESEDNMDQSEHNIITRGQ